MSTETIEPLSTPYEKLSSAYDTRNELNRKAFETMDWLVKGVHRGTITKDQFSIAIDTLFMTTSGLTDEKMVEIVTAAQEMCNKEPVVRKRYFCNDQGEIITFSWTVGYSSFTVLKRVMGQLVSSAKREFETPEQAIEGMEKMAVEMLKRAWKMI